MVRSSQNFDVAVIGGGLLGSATGYGLVRRKLRVAILDEGDVAYRAARGNFGLVWVQSKGIGFPVYADWTMRSSELWPELADDLADVTGEGVHLEQPGGLQMCLSETEFEERRAALDKLAAHQNGRFKFEMLGRNAAARMVPGLGPDVVGASYTTYDGHANPLKLMRALHAGFVRLGGRLVLDSRVERITYDSGTFVVHGPARALHADKVVLAAGLGNKTLAPQVGLDQPVHPDKGQVLVTERLDRFLDLPTVNIRQTDEGTVMLGASQEDVGFDTRSTPSMVAEIADRARRTIPALADANIVRTWAALRVMTPDGCPIYDQSETMPGAFAMSCHSGVTLAAAHAIDFARFVADGRLGDNVAGLSARRFDVSSSV